MTTQDLKDNRIEIIARINEIADASKMAEIMTAMVNLINGGMNEATEAVELVDEVVEMLGYQKVAKQTETHYEMLLRGAKNNLPSSLR